MMFNLSVLTSEIQLHSSCEVLLVEALHSQHSQQ